MMSQVILPYEDIASDLENNLGRANGNVYQRVPGVEGVHDGQIMVRLKKKRFNILDYSIIPTEEDLKTAAVHDHIKIPKNAGKAICIVPECNKIGVPVCLYDNEPGEPDCLYLRAGRCFQCQRDLNEKRRTDKKRPATAKTGPETNPSLIYALGPTNKKFKMSGKIINLKDDAIIINGGVEGLKPYGDGYGFQEIGADLHALTQEASLNTIRLVNAVAGNSATAAAAAVAALSGPESAFTSAPHDPTTAAANSMLGHDGSVAPSSSEDINALYYKAFQSMNKAIFLLSQWKASWDAATSPANNSVADTSLADAVASAAAVVAAAGSAPSTAPADGQDQNSNMVSLLLEADKHNDQQNEQHDQLAAAVAEHVQAQVDMFNQDEQAHHEMGEEPGEQEQVDVSEDVVSVDV